ncbi:MAG TPA: 1-acyl-sn-glycerol-3-phosphate acyltransferase, partial [Beijerinckiaceae bacterium]|nr:1-acyl-sn-glycerol-3-phosphate acyltransferase [Beijerinckiaceae bacterium]
HLYGNLDIPCVPIALNSGLYWPRRRFIRRPGTILVEILEPIPPGLPRKEFMDELQTRLEAASARLLAEGTARLNEAADAGSREIGRPAA